MTADELDKDFNELLNTQGFGFLKVEGVGKGKKGAFASVTLKLDRSIDAKLLERAIQANDEVTTILLFGLEIEHQLSLFLTGLIGKLPENANFHTLTLLLKGVRFDNDIYTVVDGFRRLRNKFAHDKGASLVQCTKIVDAILQCEPPTPMDQPLNRVNNQDISAYPTISKLAIFANLAVLFLASATQIYSFPKPVKRVLLTTSKSE
ncbi:MAG: hypothetical protein BroJett030_03500 [Alphaproteobacteria bacterium]|nr:MAG: hypothetical protein BroJett030_03500 [Alphaproteobacteria bacterium]